MDAFSYLYLFFFSISLVIIDVCMFYWVIAKKFPKVMKEQIDYTFDIKLPEAKNGLKAEMVDAMGQLENILLTPNEEGITLVDEIGEKIGKRIITSFRTSMAGQISGAARRADAQGDVDGEDAALMMMPPARGRPRLTDYLFGMFGPMIQGQLLNALGGVASKAPGDSGPAGSGNARI